MSTSLSLSRPVLALARPRAPHASPQPAADVQRISSQQLLAGSRELVIQHQGGEYHLRLTRNDKLILTK